MQAWIRHISVGCVAVLALACGSKGDDDDDGDGTSGNGTGGNPTAGTGGGGRSGSGGSGTSGTGGTGVVGGSGGSGGTSVSGSGGTGGSGGAPMVTQAYTFDADQEGWKAMYTSAGVGITAIDPMAVEVTWVDEGGNPDGAVQVNIPYDSKSQYVGIGLPLVAPVDLTGKTVRAEVKLVSGLGDPTELMTAPGGAKLYVKSGTGFVYANGTFTNVGAVGQWIPIAFNLAAPEFVDEMNPLGPFDPAQVMEIGIQFDTGSLTTTPAPAEFLIDNVTY